MKFCDDGGSSSSSSGSSGGGSYYSEPEPTVDYHRVYHDQALTAFRARNYVEAIRLFEESLEYRYSSVTALMLSRSRRGLAFDSAVKAHQSRDYPRALQLMNEALVYAKDANDREPTSTGQEWIYDCEDWISELRKLVRSGEEKQRWESALVKAKPRINSLLGELSNKISNSSDFASAQPAVDAGGALAFLPLDSAVPYSQPGPAAVNTATVNTVAGGAEGLPVVNPVDIKMGTSAGSQKTKGLVIKPVPSPSPVIIANSWVRMNAQKPPDMILEALKKGNGSLSDSVLYMRERMETLNPQDRDAREALSYLEALEVSERSFQVENSGLSGDQKHLLNAILAQDETGEETAVQSVSNWRASRQFLVSKALDEADGSEEEAIKYLVTSERKESEYTVQQAIRYLQGIKAYSDWAVSEQGSK